MIVGNYKYGISSLPNDCLAYKDGYRYGSYTENINDRNDIHITEWFKELDEVQRFVNANREYGSPQKIHCRK